MPLNKICVDRAIQELEQVVCAGIASSDYVEGAAAARNNDSYFVETPRALIALKSVARLAYLKCQMA